MRLPSGMCPWCGELPPPPPEPEPLPKRGRGNGPHNHGKWKWVAERVKRLSTPAGDSRFEWPDSDYETDWFGDIVVGDDL